jgi:LacI family transcriptional regulator
MASKRHIIFLQDLNSHSDREVCLGAAEYAAAKSDWSFDPWPVPLTLANAPSRDDLRLAAGIFTTEKVSQHLFGEKRSAIPRVLFLTHLTHRGVPSASLDELAIGRMAADHLYARGYRHLAFFGSSEWLWSKVRKEGFVPAVQERGLTPIVHEFPLKEVPVFWSWNVTRRNESLSRVLESLPKPCGVFAGNDVIACFVIQTAREQGYRVPEDIGVLGCDDDPVPNAAAGLAISSIQPDFREVGRQAARLLDDILHEKPVPSRVLIPPTRVVVRASTDAFMTDDPLVSRAQKYIEEHRHEPVLVEHVIRTLGTNRATLGKRFQRHLDVGLQEYILKRRIEYAREQLRDGRVSVEKIAEVCGFCSTSYFSKVFKKITGTTPGRIRAGRYS